VSYTVSLNPKVLHISLLIRSYVFRVESDHFGISQVRKASLQSVSGDLGCRAIKDKGLLSIVCWDSGFEFLQGPGCI
jgi:hypothetical protein